MKITKVNFGGFVTISTIDWYGYSVSTVFLRGCSLGCNDCQNKNIADGDDYRDIEEIEDMIRSSKSLISGVVFSGGEPLEQLPALKELIAWCKGQRLMVFLHTSGNFPLRVKEIVNDLDGIRIDYKPMEQFTDPEFAYTQKWSGYVDRFNESLLYIKNSGIEYRVSAVALRNSNESLKEVYWMLDEPEHTLIVQGNERNPLKPEEIAESFYNCYICTKQNGIERIPDRMVIRDED